MRRQWLFAPFLLLVWLVFVACASTREATPAPAGPTQTARAAWEEEWGTVLAAAKQEGKVTVLGPPGEEIREALTKPFQKRYGVSVEYMGLRGPEMASRIRTERGAGQYLWDIWITGTTDMFETGKAMKALDPIEPALLLPEVKEGKNWRGGKLEFADKDRLILAMTPYVMSPLMVNPNLAKPEEIKAYRDILASRWKGKIILHDPRVAGPGEAAFTFFYQHKDLGPDFIRALAAEKPAISRDWRQQIEWIATGKYAILVGGNTSVATPLMKEGLTVRIVDSRGLKEGGYVTSGGGTLALFNKAPHPNAAKVYINWLLNKEGQEGFSRAISYVSRRLDVPTDFVDAWMVPIEGYWAHDSEDAIASARQVVAFLNEVFPE
ncbi:MAG TPA: extracellular solute-binding protein [Dehalococcoidia bacterium]|nr:extracellular solute-binding protein [Dehalococcoidia bacterium]